MLLYHLHDWQRAALTPFRFAAEATQAAFQNPFFPATYTRFGRSVAASAEIFERMTRRFNKPVFGLATTKIKGDPVAIEEEIVQQKPLLPPTAFQASNESQ